MKKRKIIEVENIREVLKTLLGISDSLNEQYKHYNRKFTLDGHLFGSLAEVYAAIEYNLDLAGSSTKGYDALDKDGHKVQIKVTQKTSVGLRHEPERLLVLFLNKETYDFEEVYYDEGKTPWDESNPSNSAGQRVITLNKLRDIKGRQCNNTYIKINSM